MRRPNPYRQIELEQSLASGEPVISIVKRLSAKWEVEPRTIYAMIYVLHRSPRKVSEPTKTKLRKLTLDRMRELVQVMQTNEPRKAIVERYARQWGLYPTSVDRLIKRALASQRHEIDQALRNARQHQIQRKREKLTQAAEARDYDKAAQAYAELAQLMGLVDPDDN